MNHKGMALATEVVWQFARRGALARVSEINKSIEALMTERAMITRQVLGKRDDPVVSVSVRPTTKKTAAPVRTKRSMSAAQKKAVSGWMTRYWANKKRAAAQKKTAKTAH